MNIVEEFVIMLGLDGSGAKKGMANVKKAIDGGINELTGKLKGFAAAFAAAFAVQKTFTAYTAEADALGKLADAMNMNIESLHAWSEAAARSGGSAEGFQQSLQALNSQLVKTGLTGQSRAQALLENAGIDAGELGRTRDALAVMQDLAEKAETMSKAEFLGLGRSLGLDSGTIMLLQQGRAAVKDQIQAQKELGVYTKEDARVTAEWNDRIDDSAQAFKALMAVIFREVLPVFTAVVKGFNNIVSTLRKHDTFVKAFFLGLAAIITGMLVPAFTALAAAIYANPLTWIVLGLAALAAVIEDLVVWAQGGEAAFGGLWSAVLGSPEEAIKTFDAIMDGLKRFGQTAKEVVENFKNLFLEAINWVKKLWNGMVDSLGKPQLKVDTWFGNPTGDKEHGGSGGTIEGGTLSDSIPADFTVSGEVEIDTDEATTAISNAVTGIKQTVGGAVSWVQEELSGISGYSFTGTVNIAADTLEPVLNLINGIKDFSISGVVDVATKEAEKAVDFINGIKDFVVTGVVDIATDEAEKALALIASITGETVEQVRERFQGGFAYIGQALDSFIAKVRSITEGIKAAFGDAVSWVKSLWSGLIGGLRLPSFSISGGVSAGDAIQSGGSQSINNVDSDTNIGNINVYTQATDAEGISRDIGGAVNNNVGGYYATQANVGVSY